MMLSRTPIAYRIYAGFAVIGALALMLAVAAILAAGQARDNARSFRELNERTFAILEMRTEVTELQRSVQLFSTLGHESLAEEATERITGLRERFESAESFIAEANARRLVERMRTSLDNYEQSLETAVSERRLRYRLVHTDLPKLNEQLDNLAQRAIAPEDTARWMRFVEAGRGMQRNLYSYLYEPDYALLTAALDETEQLSRSARTDAEREYAALLTNYGKVFTRIVQATRGYLYLVGVVMAGEAWEFAHLSRRLRSEVLADIPSMVDSMETLTRSLRSRTLVVGSLALIGALGLSWWIGQSISVPLKEITQTLRGLVRGDPIDRIPGSDRADEIGVMAAAANAFKGEKDRTEALLEEQRDLTRQLRSSREELESSNQELEQFVYTVSHDLKTPLVTSLGFIGMMREMADAGQSELALSKLDVLERSNKRMSQLISGLLDLSRVGRTETAVESVAPGPLIRGVVDELSERLESAGCSVWVEPDLPSIRVNPTRFEQVVDNLVTNALKYGQPTDGAFEVRIGSKPGTDERVVLTISDRGPGIPPEHHDRVFGLFNRLSNTGEGTGIGLAIVQRIMQTSGGSVRITSRGNGDGCTFELEFERGEP